MRLLPILRRIIRTLGLETLWRAFVFWFGDLWIATHEPHMTAAMVADVVTLAKPGDVILRRCDGALDSRFIPGEYTHSGFVVGQCQVFHALSEGVVSCSVADFILHADAVAVIRPQYPDAEARDNAVAAAMESFGREYDALADESDDRQVYCHEYTARCLRAGGVPVDVEPGCLITADHLLQAPRCGIWRWPG